MFNVNKKIELKSYQDAIECYIFRTEFVKNCKRKKLSKC